jgi:hypothetical protein
VLEDRELDDGDDESSQSSAVSSQRERGTE